MYRFGIFGKPNVGKSSLFNVLINQNKSIVAKERGVTRDRVKGILRNEDKFLVLADLPGMEVEKQSTKLNQSIQSYLKKELKEIDVLIVVFDITEITAEDKLLYREVKKNKIPLLWVSNKVDNEKKEALLAEMYTIGDEDFFLISAKTRKNLSSFREKLFSFCEQLTKENILPKNQDILANDCEGSFSIIGKPNVGKSSFLNSFLGWERCIVKEESGTTRDAIDEFVFYRDKKYKLIDTAGIRKRKTKKLFLEGLSLRKTFHAINQADVIILLIDAKEVMDDFYRLTEQDKKLISLAQHKKKTLIIFFNKWDLLKKNKTKDWRDFKKEVLKLTPFLKNFPMEPLSCHKSFSNKEKNILFEKIFNILQSHQIEVKTNSLNEAIKIALEQYDSNFNRKKVLKIYYATQVKKSPPLFYLYVNNKKHLEKKMVDYLNNYLINYFNLLGTPLGLVFLDKEKK